MPRKMQLDSPVLVRQDSPVLAKQGSSDSMLNLGRRVSVDLLADMSVIDAVSNHDKTFDDEQSYGYENYENIQEDSTEDEPLNKSFLGHSKCLVLGFPEEDKFEDWFRIIGFLMNEIYQIR